jgi:hypothetical protein
VETGRATLGLLYSRRLIIVLQRRPGAPLPAMTPLVGLATKGRGIGGDGEVPFGAGVPILYYTAYIFLWFCNNAVRWHLGPVPITSPFNRLSSVRPRRTGQGMHGHEDGLFCSKFCFLVRSSSTWSCWWSPSSPPASCSCSSYHSLSQKRRHGGMILIHTQNGSCPVV